MSETISLKNKMARRKGDALPSFRRVLLVAGLVLLLGAFTLFANGPGIAGVLESGRTDSPAAESSDGVHVVGPLTVALSPRMQSALDYVARRYRVSEEALVPVFELAESAGQQRRIDPLLIVAVIGIESGFNPFAESAMGAQGLMQIIPRFHMDKVPDASGDKPFLDPVVNIMIGTHVLEEAIRRRGGLVAGLQYYGGASDQDDRYANKVLAEKARLEQAVKRSASSATNTNPLG